MRTITSSFQKLIIAGITALTLVSCTENKSTDVPPDQGNETIIDIETPFTDDSKKLKMIYYVKPWRNLM